MEIPPARTRWMSNNSDGSLPLSGIRVLDLATFIAAPFAATTMAEFGAEVIKIERPDGGDPLAPLWHGERWWRLAGLERAKPATRTH